MYKGLMVGAVIVAAGSSSRMGKNKLYIPIEGTPVLARTISVFHGINTVDRIILVTAAKEIDYCLQNILKKYDMNKDIEIVAGGTERQYSMMNGLNNLKGSCDIVVTHDGARPFVTAEIIEKSIETAYIYKAAACAVPVKDTIKIMDSESFAIDTLDRSKLSAVQTPQTFLFNTIYEAHIKAREEGFTGTDDTVLVERMGVKVKLFEGSYENIKITTPDDIYLSEAILGYRKNELANKG